MFTFYCGLSGLEHEGVQDHILEEVGNVWIPIAHFHCHEHSEAAASLSQTIMRIAVASGNKDFVCRLLSLNKKVKVDVRNTLDSADAVWCINTCKESLEELVVTSYWASVHTLAKFLRQLNQLTSLSILQLPRMVCSQSQHVLKVDTLHCSGVHVYCVTCQ